MPRPTAAGGASSWCRPQTTRSPLRSLPAPTAPSDEGGLLHPLPSFPRAVRGNAERRSARDQQCPRRGRAPVMDDDHRRPPGIDDTTVEAAGKLSEALEWVERARGRLYDFHQMMGRADLLMEDAADALADAGHD